MMGTAYRVFEELQYAIREGFTIYGLGNGKIAETPTAYLVWRQVGAQFEMGVARKPLYRGPNADRR